MGLLDALFQSDNYGGQGGGLLDLIRQTQGQQQNYQPSQGFPAANFADRFGAMPGAPAAFNPAPQSINSANYDPSTFAPNQAAPIAVGNNYQMPRMGGADQFQPQQAALPPNAQPAQGQLPPGQQAPQAAEQPQELPPAFGGTSYLERLNAGGGLIGSMLGDTSQQRNMTAQYHAIRKALMDNGETPQAAASKAMIAAMNPEAAKTIIPELFTSKEKYGVVSEDPFAGKKYGFINERDQTVNGKPINAQGGPAGSSTPLVDMENAKAAGVTGDALYEYLPKQIAPMVKAMVEGRQPLPTGAAMRNPATLALIDAAHSVDPTFDATSWATRVKGQADFYGGGKSSEIMRKANQSALHFGELVSDKMAELPGHTMPAANAVANFVNTNLLGKGAQGNFMVNAHALADELAGLFKGANLSDTEIRAWESRLTPDMSVEQQQGMAKALLGLYRDSITALDKKRVESIGQAAADKKGPILGPEAEAALSGVKKFADGGERVAPGGVNRSAIEAEMRKRGLLK